MSRRSTGWALALTAVLGLASFLAVPATAAGAITPGVMILTDGAQCTANFVFSDDSDTFIGQAAHCSGTGVATDTNGCDSGSLPLGTPVEVTGASKPGTLVYNSWLTMQQVGETDVDACAYNDFALVKLDPADAGRVSPDIPVLGGPNGIDRDGVAPGEQVSSYGNSSLRQGLTQLSPKLGLSLGTAGNGWTHPVYTLTPGIPGDSGSPFVNSSGQALGVLSTLSIAPTPLSNNVSDLGRMLDYANSTGGQHVTLVQGGAFDGGGLSLLRGLLG
ncbi:MAG: hypothetical protein ACR2K2_06570 [Mycobacteriales bacterium]